MAPTMLELGGHARVSDDTWILHLAYTKNPLPMNGSRGGSFHAKARTSKVMRRQSKILAQAAKIPALGRCSAQLTWWVNTTRTRDVDNLAAFEKPLFDGLVDAGVVVDDNPELMTKHRAIIRHLPDPLELVTAPCFTLTVHRIGTDA